MKNKKKFILLLVLIPILLLIYFSQKRVIDNFSMIPQRVEMSFDSDNKLLDYILSEKEYISENYMYALYIEKEIVLDEKPLMTIGINEDYRESETLELLNGRDSHLSNGQIIISDILSKERYGTVDSIGETMELEGNTYEIIGIYKANENNIVYENDIVYIDYEDAKDNLDDYASIISIIKPSITDDEFFKDRFIDDLMFKLPDVNEELLNIRDYSDASRVLMEWHRGIKLLTFTLLAILIAIVIIKRIKRVIYNLKRDLQLNYLSEIVSLRINEILGENIILALLIFSEIFLLRWIIRFQFNIPGRYLPANDIFDFNFYRTLADSMNISRYGDLYNITLSKVKLLALLFFIISIVIFVLITKMLSSQLQGGVKNGRSNI